MASWANCGWGLTPDHYDYHRPAYGFEFEAEVPIKWVVFEHPNGHEVTYRRCMTNEKPDAVLRGSLKDRERFERSWKMTRARVLETTLPSKWEPLYEGIMPETPELKQKLREYYGF